MLPDKKAEPTGSGMTIREMNLALLPYRPAAASGLHI